MVGPIYIAAPFVRQQAARDAREWFAFKGIKCNSHWLDIEANGEAEDVKDKERLVKESVQDFQDIWESHGFVLLNIEKSEGKIVELGIAMGLAAYLAMEHDSEEHYPIVSIGPRTNIFHFHPMVKCVETLEEAHEYLISSTN